ncbi:glycosyltransferase family 31 protein [Trematosphaeria pertusa]|uniref:Glycosyltransferase family 31 protein n=1 Tax=Trematosphaeria pertusa TaxID=390896 RepID=A0A6A6IIK3_9PLEO|nr:glycosyltransferase family 31 protein [Trematosphaeria pertusa]KAF2250196.1 glycosyltransferase family 31 protein [Trematosphaeria pertusa]
MPPITPSRVAVLVLSLSLMSFLWTFGLPHQLASPSLPIISHDPPKGKPLTEPLIPQPLIESTTQSTQETIPTPRPALSSHAEQPARVDSTTPPVSGEGGKGRPGDGQGQQEGSVLPKETAAPVPSGSNGTAASASPSPTPVGSTKFCKDVHGAPNVMVIVKTSKAEISEKIPNQLLTLLSCVPNFAIFSDHAGTIDGFTVHDALDSVSNTSRTLNDEFREYDKIQADPEYKPDAGKTKALDKWKFLPMVYKAYKMRPHQKFYIFIEADTSLSWTNLLQWMDRLDYRIPYYSGAPMFQGSTKYAQRGPGILLSNGALRQYAKSYNERYVSEWESQVGKECCGDMVLANAMTESHVEFYSAFPLLQGETPSTLDWTKRHWCAPIVSWHHMTADEIDLLWGFQRNWTHKYGWEVPYLIRNAFEEFISPHLEEKKEDWDNISSDTKIVAEQGRRERLAKEKAEQEAKTKDAPAPTSKPEPPSSRLRRRAKAQGDKYLRRDTIDWDKIGETIKDAADSAEHCQSVCKRTEDCVQWKYTPKGDGECHLGKTMRLGRKFEKREGRDSWTSGWMVDRIKKVTEEWGQCEKPSWRFNQ